MVGLSGGRFAGATSLKAVTSVLSLGFVGSTLELLTDAPKKVDQRGLCCDYAQVSRRNPAGALSPPETIVADLGQGDASGQLLPTGDGRVLAVDSSAAGISVAAARGAGRFGLAHLIGRHVFTIATGVLSFTADALGGVSAVAYSTFFGNRLQLAVAAPGLTPDRARTVVAIPSSEMFDDYKLAIHGASIGLAWVHGPQNGGSERVEVADVGPTGSAVRPRTLGAGSAGRVALAGNHRGEEIVGWAACRRRCPLQVQARRGGGALGAPQTLGYLDKDEVPLVALSPNGDGLVVWVQRGRVRAAKLTPGTLRFGTRTRSRPPGAGGPALVYGPRGEAIAVWSQGPFPRVEAAVFRAG